jgi:glycine cleavage system H protein
MATEYDEGRCWYKKSGKRVQLGLTSLALDEIGQIEKVTLPTEGDSCDEGDVLAEIEGSIGTLEVIAPMAGIVAAVNENLQDSPEIIAEDPTDEGWLMRLKIDLGEEESDENDSEE